MFQDAPTTGRDDDTRVVQLTEAEQIVTLSALEDAAQQKTGTVVSRLCRRVIEKIRNALPRRRASLMLVGRREARHESELV